LSGGTRSGDLDRYAYQPDKIVNSIADLDHTQLVREFTEFDSSPRTTRNLHTHGERALASAAR
jgi:NagD protein